MSAVPLRHLKDGALMTTELGSPGPYAGGSAFHTRCPAGHLVAPEAAFCPTCGVARPGSGGTAQITPGGHQQRTPATDPLGTGAAAAPPGEVPVLPFGVEPSGFGRPADHRRRRISVAGGVLVLAAGAAVLVPLMSGGGSATTAVSGTFVLTDSDTAYAGCIGQGGYADISPEVAVILAGQDNTILGSTSLGVGSADTAAGTCTYHFAVPDVPKDQSQYVIEVSQRGKIVNSKAEMRANGWTFGLSMGR
jgi:hypothetical protein